jgi:hypothetical protein
LLKRLDFESGSLRQWAGIQAAPGRIRVVPSPVRQGHFAAKFTVKPGDHPVSGGERAEVWWNSHEHEGTESWWRWSTLFPKGFHPNRGYWNFFTQWHHTGTTCMPPVSFTIANPAPPAKLRLQIWGGRLNTSTCSPQYQHLWNIGKLRRHHWYRFVFHVKWSSYPSKGFVSLRVNGHTRVPKTHLATLYRGYGVYVKQGFYRGESLKTTTLYHDGLQRFRP